MNGNLNHKHFGIMDVAGNQVAAGAGFAYRGYIISMSQVLMNTPDVVVFDGWEIVYNATSVQDACEWCNTQLTGFKY